MDLDNSMFFEKRLLTFIQKLLSNQYVRPINDFENQLLQNEVKLKKINLAYNSRLSVSLQEYANYITVKDCLTFLFEAEKIDAIETAKEIMDWAVKEESSMNIEQLLTSLKNYDTMPTSFLPSLYGEYTEEGEGRVDKDRQNQYSKPGSSLDLDRLRNFK